MRRLIIGLMVMGVSLTIGLALPAFAAVDPAQLGKAVTAIEQLDQMRSGLAAGLEDTSEEPTIETFMEVCAPVGMQANTIAQENGWEVRQVAAKDCGFNKV
ncbi:MAG: hypothetical protein ACO3EZ_18330 [Prochlorotrichaceae cyanobacterium]